MSLPVDAFAERDAFLADSTSGIITAVYKPVKINST